MKNSLILLALLLLAPALGSAGEVFVVLSPWLRPADRAAQKTVLDDFLLRDAPAGLRVVLVDGWTGQNLAGESVPQLKYDNRAARAQTREIFRLRTVLKRWESAAQDNAAPSLVDSGAVDTLEVLQKVGSDRATAPRAVVLVGSPLYRSLTDASYSMIEGRYPADGHLSASHEESIYSTVGNKDRLRFTTILWVPPAGKSTWLNFVHKEHIIRFWALWSSTQGGTLASMDGDLGVALAQAQKSDLPPVVPATIDLTDAKPVMRDSIPPVSPIWKQLAEVVEFARPTPPAESPKPDPVPVVTQTAESSPPPSPAPEPVIVFVPRPVHPVPVTPDRVPVIPDILPVPITITSETKGLGLAWAAQADVDLHVVPAPGGREISYLHDRDPQGRLFKDERRSTAGRVFEFIEFSNKALDFGKSRIRVHYYSGKAERVSGQIVIFEQGLAKVATFTVSRAQPWADIAYADFVAPNAPLLAAKPTGR